MPPKIENAAQNPRIQPGEDLGTYAYRSLLAQAMDAGFDPSADPLSDPAPYDVTNPAIQKYAHLITNDNFMTLRLNGMLNSGSTQSDANNLVRDVGYAWSIRTALGQDSPEDISYVHSADDLVNAIVNSDEAEVTRIVMATPQPEAPDVESPEVFVSPEAPSQPALAQEDQATTIFGREVSPELAAILRDVPSGDEDAITDAMSIRYDLMREAIPNQPALEAIALSFGAALKANEDGSISLDPAIADEMKIQIEDTTFVDPVAGVELDYTGAGDASAYIGTLADTGEISVYEPTVVSDAPAAPNAPAIEHGISADISSDTSPVAHTAPTLIGSPSADVLSPMDTSIPEAPQTPPAVAPEEEAKDSTEYTVVGGDNLWKIAREHYGLEKAADIQRAVETIARANELGEGVEANHIDIGQVLKLPDSPVSEGPALDWAALDRDSGLSITKAFDMAVAGTRVADNSNPALQESTRPVARPDVLTPAA